jgi:hypothetical protein
MGMDISFSYTLDSNRTVHYTNTSNPVDSFTYKWLFNKNANTGTSQMKNPSYQFNSDSVYKTCLTAYKKSTNDSCITCKNISINKCFVQLNSSSSQPFLHRVDNRLNYLGSQIDSIYWDFGDHKPSSSYYYWSGIYLNDHWYDSIGNYEIKVQVINIDGDTCRDTANISVPLIASFVSQVGPNNQVNFINTSQPLDSLTYNWQFGNGNSSTLKHPSATYNPGDYYPDMLATNSQNQNSYAGDTLIIDTCFVGISNSWINDSTQQFNIYYRANTFKEAIIDYGDGSTNDTISTYGSQILNNFYFSALPPHTFPKDSTYMVSILAKDSLNVSCVETIMVETGPCRAFFTKKLDTTTSNKVILVNRSSDSPNNSYSYFFNDPNNGWGSRIYNSALRTANYTYSNYGSYLVRLELRNYQLGCNTFFADTVGLDSLGNLKANGFTVEFVDSAYLAPVGLNKNFGKKELINRIYPNPSFGVFTIEFNQLIENASIVVYNRNAQKILEGKVIDDKVFSLNLKDLSQGIYFLQISEGNTSWIEKLVKY